MINKYLKEVASDTKLLFVSYIQNQFLLGQKVTPETATKSTAKKLHLRDRTGLAKSFETDSTAELTNNNLEIVLQSNKKYAGIHNTGGFIKAKPVTVTNRNTGVQRQTYRMALFFWAMFFKSSNEYWKALALSVQKRGGVEIPKRPYFDEGIKQLRMNLEKDFVEGVFLPKMIEFWNNKMEKLK
jgi:phage gpG-like protein